MNTVAPAAWFLTGNSDVGMLDARMLADIGAHRDGAVIVTDRASEPAKVIHRRSFFDVLFDSLTWSIRFSPA